MSRATAPTTSASLVDRIRRRRADRGAVLPITALILTVLITTTAFAIDLGRLRSERRDLQALADAIALDAASVIGGLSISAAQPLAVAEANDSASRNGLGITLTDAEVTVGQWNVANQELEFDTNEPVDAVQVDLHSTLPMYFDLSADERSVSRRAVAYVQAQTKGSIGAVFSGIQAYDPTAGCAARAQADAQMSFMNSLYTEFFQIDSSGGIGTAADFGASCEVTGPTDGLQLDALSWQGLANGQVSLADVAGRMGFGSVDELMSSDVNARDFYTASADAMNASGDTADVTAGGILGTFASDIDNSATIPLPRLGSASVGNGESAADTKVNALGLLSAGAQAIDGNNFVSADLPVDLPFTDATITPRISVIEPPTFDDEWKYVGQPGPTNSQIKIGLEIPLTDVLVDFGALGVLAPLGVQTTGGNLALVIEVAKATTTHTDIACSPDLAFASHVSTMEAETGAVSVSVGTATDAELQQADDVSVQSTSALNGTFGLTILGVGVNIDLEAVSDVDQTYTYDGGAAFVGGHDTNIGLLGDTESHDFDVTQVDPLPADPGPSDSYRYDGGLTGTSITDHTYGNLTYNTSAGLLSSLGVADAAVTNLITGAIDPVTDEVGPEVIEPLLAALGVTVGGADGQILGVRCQVPTLANRDSSTG